MIELDPEVINQPSIQAQSTNQALTNLSFSTMSSDNQNNNANVMPNPNEQDNGTSSQPQEENPQHHKDEPRRDNDEEPESPIEEISELRRLFDRLEMETNREKPRTWVRHDVDYMKHCVVVLTAFRPR